MPNNKKVFVKDLAKNLKLLIKFIGFEMSQEEVVDMWDKGIVSKRAYQQYLEKEKSPKNK